MTEVSTNQVDIIIDQEGRTLFATSDFNDLEQFRTRTHDLPADHRTVCIGDVQKLIDLVELVKGVNPIFQSDEIKQAVVLAHEAQVKVFPMSERA